MEGKDIHSSTVQALNVTIASLSKTNEAQAKTIASLELRIKELSAQVAYLNRQLFGRKSEKLQPQNPLQMDLFADMPVDTPAEPEQTLETVTREVIVNKKQAR